MTYHECDNINCKSNTTDLSQIWITIGSKNGNDLKIKNNHPFRGYQKDNHRDIHFCSKPCLIDYFFDKNKQ